MSRATRVMLCAALGCLPVSAANAVTTTFFDGSELATLVASGTTSDTIRSKGYLFTYTRDKLFTGGTGTIIGRQVRIPWPQGVEAQAVTAGPNPSKAQITIRRADGQVFDLTAFTARLLANTAGAGGSIEVMPVLNGEDAFNDPVPFFASGYSWSVFAYDTTTPSYLGNTLALHGFEAYKITLYVDFALTGMTLVSPAIPGNFDGDTDVDALDLDALKACISGSTIPAATGCELKDLDFDGDVDQNDFGVFQRCYSGTDQPADPACAD